MKYLGIEPSRPKIAVFDFTSCEGCELQLANQEETLVDFLKAIDVVRFREVTTDALDEYDVALVEGAISRSDEVARLQAIREKAKVLVAFGTCARTGGVSRLKNAFNLDLANREVYGDCPKETEPVRPIRDVVKVDLEIPGCPVNKAEVERVVQHLIWDVPYKFPAYPVCLECKQRYISCVFMNGQLCLGAITMGGCNAPCPAGGDGCWGCRGKAAECNMESFLKLSEVRGFSEREVKERLNFFGGFEASR